jgi:TetR/AcrR family transcriptional regulator, transcriptional repressor for nem operon
VLSQPTERTTISRPREFDVEQAIEAALEVFWRQGYDGTSVEDLLAATGLHKGSLYKAFGDKRALFITALERYISYLHGGWKQTRAAHPSPRNALRQWFHGLVTFKGAFKGCLVVNSSAEVAPRDAEIAAMLRNFTSTFRAGFAEAIEHGKQLGEFPPHVDAQLAGELLVIVMFGIRVVGKHSPLSLGLVDVILGSLV